MSLATRVVPSHFRQSARRGGALVAALATLACAGNGARAESAVGTPGAALVARPDTPPRLVASRPLVFSVPASSGAPDFWYTVRVEADGKPNLSTLVVGGTEGTANRSQIRAWLTTATFAPALLDGVPVAADFDSRRR